MAKTTKKAPEAKPKAAKKATPGKKKVTKKVAAQQAPAATAAANKAPAKKTSATKKVAKRAASKKTAPRKAAAKGAPKQITFQQRHELVAQAAYFISESQGFFGDANADWLAAEAEVDARLAEAGIELKG